MTTNTEPTLYGGQPQKHWEDLAKKQPETFFEFAHNALLGHDDAWIKDAYQEATFTRPVKAFRFSANFASRPWAKDLLMSLAAEVPDAAVEDFMAYAYPRGNTSVPHNINRDEISARFAASYGTAAQAAEWNRDKTVPKPERIKHNRAVVQKRAARAEQLADVNISFDTARAALLQSEENNAMNKMRPWAIEVLGEALMKKPLLARINPEILLAAVSGNIDGAKELAEKLGQSSVSKAINDAIALASGSQAVNPAMVR
jgi:hypothetical protein